MTDAEIMQAEFDSMALRWEIEDQVRYGSPSNVRVVLLRHPEHIAHLARVLGDIRHTP